MRKPKINILTRTSNRPNGFSQTRKSIENQTYKNIRHIVSVDDTTSEVYVKKYTSDYILVDKDELKRMDSTEDPNTGGEAAHNLYFNELLKEVKEGWVMFLDDDDILVDEDSVQQMVDNITNEDSLIMWQMLFPSQLFNVLPTNKLVGKKPVVGKIGSPCFLFHSKYISKVRQWDGWRCSDFRFISSLYETIPNKVAIKEPLVEVTQIGRGQRVDIELDSTKLPTSNGNSIEETPINDEVAIIFCNWDRSENIPKILECLKKQVYQNFEIYIWNNNIKDRKYLSMLSGINVYHSNTNIGGIGRFYLGRMLSHRYNKIIFIDDDQTFDENFVLNMVNAFEPKTIKSRWGWKLSKEGYFSRKRVTGNDIANYVGTGGMILDSKIFNHDEVFNIPEEYLFIEDLWLSYVSNKIGFTNHGINEVLVQHEDGKDQYKKIGGKKDEFFKYLLNDLKWDITTAKKKRYKYIVGITSYNRYDLLTNQIDKILSFGEDVKIIVSDDCSSDERYLSLPQEYPDVTFVRTKQNNGKKGYWKTINMLLSKVKEYESPMVIHLDDDFEISDDLLRDLEPYRLKEDFIIIYAPNNYNRVVKWGTKHHVDACFTIPMSYLKKTNFTIDKIPLSRFNKDPKISSGVWQQMTFKLNDLGYKTKFLGYSLCKHIGNQTSLMNPKERAYRPLITYKYKDEPYD
jgi:GT2 family glycosyltransferase